ncbi:hypothetical protein [Hymenobacter cellulosilyticus]|uniref:Phosphatase PAP2 family protein n=1 Tax=Hymenobacter cellulosilyticus TaxID=2932248 RepID=A0A8T9Q7Q7_9BACT|nr:hypothetical protein [Hymenobacter cellulosilyticus]UOQ71549.1 hypothetical protein MUN79_23500 [Hymenobacter cellulosilyticus]
MTYSSVLAASQSRMVLRLAKLISTLAHPFITGPLLLACVAFRAVDGRTAGWMTGGMLGLVMVPITLWNYQQIRAGAYSSLDVSDQEQRHSFYPRLIGLLLLAITTLTVVLPVSTAVRDGLSVLCLMLVACFGLTFLLKVSLHAAITFFLTSALYSVQPEWGLAALVASTLVAASRLVLGQHTLSELLAGTALGLGTGVLLVLS